MRTSLATPPAVVMFASSVQGVEEHVAPLVKVCSVGVLLNEPAAHAAVPQVSAPLRMDVLVPAVRIGVTVGDPASAQHATD